MVWHIFLQGLLYALAGTFAGLMSGLLGIGGGIVVVPALLYIFQHQHLVPFEFTMQFAAGTSLAVMIFISQSSIRSHLKLGDVLWSVYQKMWPGIVVGIGFGTVSARFIPTFYLERIFGLFLIFVAWKMLSNHPVRDSHHFPRAWIHQLVTVIIGFKSGLLGIGGGTLIIPYLTYCGINPRKIAAISSLCTLTVAVFGTALFIYNGWHYDGFPPLATGFVYWPAVFWVALPSMIFAPIGAKLSYILPVMHIRRAFVVMLLFTAATLLL